MDGHTYDSWGNDAENFGHGVCIGIDLGTTNSCVGVWRTNGNHVKILKNQTSRGRTTPSVVHFDPASERHTVGAAAVELEASAPTNTVRTVKRLMGQKFDSKAVEVARSMAAYSIVATKRENVAIDLQRSNKSVQVEPEHVSGCILAALKESAEAYFEGQVIDNVVITVPAYFSDSQRKATISSAIMAGFKGIRLLNEPTAAAMAYGLFLAGTKKVVVFDFGGGTLDVSLMSISEGRFEVLGIGGDTNLGGEDISHLIVEHLVELLTKHHGVQRGQLTPSDMLQLKTQAELAKLELSSEEEVAIELTNVAGVAQFSHTLTRRKLELLCDGIFKRSLRIIHNVLKEAHVHLSEIDEVIMVGGATRMPAIRSKVSEAFMGKELCLSVNADEVVCEGAAIQAAILSGLDKRVFRDVLMLDVLPLPIGLETADGRMEIILPKNARIPCSVTKHFETYEDHQRGLTIEVYEGEAEVAKENDHICYFNSVIPRNKVGTAGEFLHPVTFTMNASGVLQVQAGVHHDSEEEPMSNAALYVMSAYIAALAALYVFCRMYFRHHHAMAEALFQLSEELTWAPTSAPQGELIVIQDTVEATGATSWRSSSKRANHCVCFVTFANSKEHYVAVGRKLGVNLTSMLSSKKLEILDFFSQEMDVTLSQLMDKLVAFVGTKPAAPGDDDAPVSIVIDDISALKWMFGAKQTVNFLRCCRALTHTSNRRANVVVLSHSDTDPVDTTLDAEPAVNPALVDMSTIVFSVSPLPSGYCKDVHGTLAVQRQVRGFTAAPESLSIPYKILENSIRCFRSGGDALRSI
ncbi:TPA: hypothetical protein N0F65_007572 [Lagenidium giganteum]|uniref:Heat shock protein 70 n=1 Tax=Lagenidium giganteum TaxID=4803 RepID=A0AAV2ZIX7_9STRA|nr:TPA: hypothetical protein N0F65_007572 [Lagenidium giganteum]